MTFLVSRSVADPGSVKRGGGPGIQISENIPEKTPEKKKSAKKGGGGPRQIRPPPPLDPPPPFTMFWCPVYI